MLRGEVTISSGRRIGFWTVRGNDDSDPSARVAEQAAIIKARAADDKFEMVEDESLTGCLPLKLGFSLPSIEVTKCSR